MNCDAIHQTNTSSSTNAMEAAAAQEIRQEATISADGAAREVEGGQEMLADLKATKGGQETTDLKAMTVGSSTSSSSVSVSSATSSSRCGDHDDENDGDQDEDDDDDGPGDVPQKMGLVRFMELNNNNNNSKTRNNDSDDDEDDDADEEESIDIFNIDSVVVSPMIQKYTLKTTSDELLRQCGGVMDTTEHTVTESSSCSSSSSSTDYILDDPTVEASLLSSWQCIRSSTAAAAAAASAAVLATAAAATSAAHLPPLRVASDDDRVQPEQDEEDDVGHYKVQLQDLKRHCVLGEGFLGKVWLVSDDSTATTRPEQDNHHDKNSCYALKRLSKCDLMNEDLIDAVIQERDLLREMFHPGIVKLIASYQDERYVYLLQDYCPGGELFSLMAKQQSQSQGGGSAGSAFSEDACRFYTACLTDALWYMHVCKRVVYRDLKPENVMIDRLGYPILVDFGHARKLVNNNNTTSSSESDEQEQQDEQDDEPAKAYTLCGTPKFVAPEMIQGSGHGFAVDYWSLGIILYQMLSKDNQHPFQYDDDMDDFTLYETIVQDEYMPLNTKDDVSPEAADLVHGLLCKDPQERLGAVDESATHNGILEHAFYFSKINVGLLRRRLIPAPWVPRLKDSLDASHFDDFEHINNKCNDNNTHHHLGMSSLHLSLRDQEKFANF